MSLEKPIIALSPTLPLRIIFFSSGGPGNLSAAFDVADLAPSLLSVGLVVTDRYGIPAIDLARARGIPVITRDFEAECGPRPISASGKAEYVRKARQFHDRLSADVAAFEARAGQAHDLAVLAYRRIIHGHLLERFAGKMINQHPADLSVMNAEGNRAYTGIGGHARALRSGAGGGRTSTILVDEGVDTGEILCQGPWLPYSGDGSGESIRRHENIQKTQSDWPSLKFVLVALALGGFTASSGQLEGGSRALTLFGTALPRHGYRCGSHEYLDLLIRAGHVGTGRRSERRSSPEGLT